MSEQLACSRARQVTSRVVNELSRDQTNATVAFYFLSEKTEMLLIMSH